MVPCLTVASNTGDVRRRLDILALPSLRALQKGRLDRRQGAGPRRPTIAMTLRPLHGAWWFVESSVPSAVRGAAAQEPTVIRTDFEALRDLPGKSIQGDIRFTRPRAAHPLMVAADIRIANGREAAARSAS